MFWIKLKMRCLIFLAITRLVSSAYDVDPLCQVDINLKEECGYPGIVQSECHRENCCWDDRLDGVSWCYKAMAEILVTTTTSTKQPTTTPPPVPITFTTKPFLKNGMSLFAIVQMKKDGVPQHIITSLLADALPDGQLLYALRDGKLDASEYLELAQNGGLELSPMLSYYASGGDMKNIIYERLADMYNVDPGVMQLMMTDKKDIAVKHIVARMSRNQNLNPMSNFVLTAMTSEMGITRKGIMGFVVDQMFKAENVYSKEAFKAMMSGDKKMAIRWSLLAASSKNQPLEIQYPKNEAMFAYLVDTQNRHPGKITPGTILSLALGQKISGLNPDKSFMDLFGVKAMDYVCASHHEPIRKPCRALADRIKPSSLECMNAGCCLRENKYSQIECFDNLLGSIGIAISTHILDVQYIIDNIFDGELPVLADFYPDGIPWITSRTIPNQFTSFGRRGVNQASFFNTFYKNGVAFDMRPTILPTGPSKFRPDFVWKPHGATAFPYPTILPGEDSAIKPAVTDAPGIFGGLEDNSAAGSSGIVKTLSLNVFSSCHGINADQRFFCLSNSVALSSGGKSRCESLDCCYDPIWQNISIAACFRKASYGQCHTVAPAERRDCGKPGISKDDCLADQRCCYDSSTNAETHGASAPWCYYKKQSFITEEERCSAVSNDNRIGCFPISRGLNYNNIVSQATCENAHDCCYERVKMSYLERSLGKKLPPVCFKKLNVVITRTVTPPTEAPTDPPPDTPAPDPFCSTETAPGSREDCGNFNYHDCVNVMECCYVPEYVIPNIPWCFKQSK